MDDQSEVGFLKLMTVHTLKGSFLVDYNLVGVFTISVTVTLYSASKLPRTGNVATSGERKQRRIAK